MTSGGGEPARGLSRAIAVTSDARLVRATASVVFGLSALVMLGAVAADPPRPWLVLATVMGLVAGASALAANAAGHPRWTAIGFSIATLVSVSIGNLGNPGASGFLVSSMIAGLLLGPWAAVGAALIGCLVLTGIALWTGASWLGFWTNQVALLLGGASLVALVCAQILGSMRREHEAANRYRTLVEHQPLGVLAVDQDLRVQLANDAYVKLMGIESVDDIVGMNLRDTPAYQIPEIRSLIHRVLEGEHVIGEVALTTIAGKQLTLRVHGSPVLDEAGRVIGGQANCEDYTARQAAERALVESEARFRAIAEGETDMVTEIREDGSHAFVSPNVWQLFGIPAERLREGNVAPLLHPDDRERVAAANQRVRESGKPERIEFRLYDGGGAIRSVESCLAPFVTAEEEVRLVTVSRDVTQRRRLEDDLRQAYKMEAVGQLAAGVAHDFNNLLTVIGGRAELLIEAPDAPEEQRESAAEILGASERAATLTRQLLTFSRKQPVDDRLVDFDESIGGLAEMLVRILGEHIELHCEFDAAGAHVRCDPASVEQLVVNLALNARDAMPEGGQLQVATSTEPTTGSDAGRVILVVSDTGVGIAPEARERIFEPFFTTKPVGQGTGMGLATSYAIVERLGGEISFESTPRVGSAFRVSLPCSWQPSPQIDSLPEQGRTPRPRPATILLVEDESAVRAVTRAILEEDGHQVLEAEDGDEALALARSRPGIDAVLTDLVMPRRGGLSLAKELRINRPELPILMMSGHLPRSDVPLPAPLVRKPFTRDELRTAVSSLLDAHAAG